MALMIRIIGVTFAAAFVCVGLVAAAAVLPLVIGATLVAALFIGSAGQDNRLVTWTGRSPRALAGLVACAVPVVVYLLIGVVVLVGGATAALLVVAALGFVVHRVLRPRGLGPGEHSGTASTPSVPRPDPQPAPLAFLPSDVASRSVGELCRAWRLSYLALDRTRDPRALEQVVSVRQRYLDELGRRDPTGFQRWLDEGARAASDPSRYIRGGSEAPRREDDPAA